MEAEIHVIMISDMNLTLWRRQNDVKIKRHSMTPLILFWEAPIYRKSHQRKSFCPHISKSYTWFNTPEVCQTQIVMAKFNSQAQHGTNEGVPTTQ